MVEKRKYTKRKTTGDVAVTGALGRPLLLEVAAGFGFKAVIHEGYLQIQQADNKGDVVDTIVLSKAEARRLFEEFEEWVG